MAVVFELLAPQRTCGESSKLTVWPPVRKCRPSCTLASTTALLWLPEGAAGAAAAATASDEAAQAHLTLLRSWYERPLQQSRTLYTPAPIAALPALLNALCYEGNAALQTASSPCAEPLVQCQFPSLGCAKAGRKMATFLTASA